MSGFDNIASKFHYQFLSQILVTCINQAKLNENFRLFSLQQQKFILSHVWSECFVLRASHWSIDITPIIEQYVYLHFIWDNCICHLNLYIYYSIFTRADVMSQHWKRLSMKRRNLKPILSKFHCSKHSFYAEKVNHFHSFRVVWILLIKFVFLFFSFFLLKLEYALSPVETKHIEHLTNGALIALGHYSLQRMQWTRFGKLLLALRCISLRNFDSILKQLFKNVINDIINDRNVAMS